MTLLGKIDDAYKARWKKDNKDQIKEDLSDVVFHIDDNGDLNFNKLVNITKLYKVNNAGYYQYVHDVLLNDISRSNVPLGV
eukprot:5844532-Prymnesium_polylepis.1